jgi:hypothetical protein
MSIEVRKSIFPSLPIIVFIVFVEVPVLSVIYPLIEVLTIYPILISLIFSLAVFAYKFQKSEKNLKRLARQIMALFVIFWLLSQITMVVAVESKYHGIVNEYARFFKENLKEKSKMNSSWAIVVAYRDEFEGTYGRSETLPNRIITRDSGFYLGFTLFLAYLEWFDGLEKLTVLQKKGNCKEFAIAIKTVLRDVTGLETREVDMEGFDHAFPEIYWSGSWWVFDGIFTTPNYPVKAESYAEHLKGSYRNVYESLYNLKDDTGISVLDEHGFNAVNVTITAIIDPAAGEANDRPAKNAEVEIFALKNWYDPLIERGETDESGKYQTVLRSYGVYVVTVKTSDNRFVGVVEVNGEDLEDGDEIVVRLHKYE